MLEQERTQEAVPSLERERRYSDCPVVVLVTDFGDDLAAAECRLALAGVFQDQRTIPPELVMVNDVDPFNRVHAAFNLCRLAAIAPPKTVFIGVVDPGVGTARRGIVIKTEREHFFIGPDNGIFYPAVQTEGIASVWQIKTNYFTSSSTTFHGRDVFSVCAAKVACGITPDYFGQRIGANNLVVLEFQPNQIIHTDAYGNYKIFSGIPEGVTGLTLNQSEPLFIPFVRTYEDVGIGQPLAYLGSSGLLEIAVRERSAAQFFGFKIGDCLKIQYNI